MKRYGKVVGGLLLIGGLVYVLFFRQEPPPAADIAPPPPASTPQAPTVPDVEELEQVASARVATRKDTIWIRNRAEFEAALNAQGLRGAELVNALRDWRIAHGYVAPDPLVDDRDSPSPTATYDTLDVASLRNLADGGDMLALQLLASRTLAPDALGALGLFAKAAQHGSTAGMFQVGRMLRDFAGITPTQRKANPDLDRKLLEIQGGNPGQDFRELALAWGLAAIRQDGPAVADARDVEWLEQAAQGMATERITAACGRSLAVFAEMMSARRGASTDHSLPPVFVAPTALYERLPCGNGPAAVSPPPDLASCTSQPVSGELGRAMDLWICVAK